MAGQAERVVTKEEGQEVHIWDRELAFCPIDHDDDWRSVSRGRELESLRARGVSPSLLSLYTQELKVQGKVQEKRSWPHKGRQKQTEAAIYKETPAQGNGAQDVPRLPLFRGGASDRNGQACSVRMYSASHHHRVSIGRVDERGAPVQGNPALPVSAVGSWCNES